MIKNGIKRKFLNALTVVAIAIVCLSHTVFADTGIKILLDGKDITPTGVQAEMKDGRVFVPLRFVTEKMNCTVDWNGATKEVTINNDIVHTVSSSYAIVKSTSKAIDIGVPSYIKDGSTMVSVRMISEGLGADVKWDGNTKTVTISTKEQTPISTEQPQQSITENEYNLPQGSKVINAYYANSKVMKDGNSGGFLNQLYIEFELNGKTYYSYDAYNEKYGTKLTWSANNSDNVYLYDNANDKRQTWILPSNNFDVVKVDNYTLYLTANAVKEIMSQSQYVSQDQKIQQLETQLHDKWEVMDNKLQEEYNQADYAYRMADNTLTEVRMKNQSLSSKDLSAKLQEYITAVNDAKAVKDKIKAKRDALGEEYEKKKSQIQAMYAMDMVTDGDIDNMRSMINAWSVE